MGQTTLGELEEIVVMIVAILDGEAYSVGIINEMKDRLDREVSLGAIQTVLKRLENKGLLKSEFGRATNERGGKKKRLYEITAEGQEIIDQTREQRNALWEAIPKLSFHLY